MLGRDVAMTPEQWTVAGESLTIVRGGTGSRILVLHDEWGIEASEEIWHLLGERVEIIAPIAPGFGDTAFSSRIKGVRDLALLYNALLSLFAQEPITVVGVSFGAWVAIEMAVMNQSQIAELILLGPLGLRFGAPEQRNFADLFALSDAQLIETLYMNADVARVVTGESPRDEVITWARNREASAFYGWEPYLHTPGLQRWTEHVANPVTIVHGGDDRFVMKDYFQQYAESCPRSSRIEIDGAGHFPHLDDPRQTFEAFKALLP